MTGEEVKNQKMGNKAENSIEEAGFKQARFLREFLYFLMHNTKWWLTPIIIVLLLALLIVLGGSAAAPFISALF